MHVVGKLPSGLPGFSVPPVTDLELVTALGSPTVIVGVFSYILAMSIVKTMSIKYKYPTDASKELVALGAANVVGSFFGAFPAAGKGDLRGIA